MLWKIGLTPRADLARRNTERIRRRLYADFDDGSPKTRARLDSLALDLLLAHRLRASIDNSLVRDVTASRIEWEVMEHAVRLAEDAADRLSLGRLPLVPPEHMTAIIDPLILIARQTVAEPARRRLSSREYLSELLAGTSPPEHGDESILAELLDKLAFYYATKAMKRRVEYVTPDRKEEEFGGEGLERLFKELDRVLRRIDRTLSQLERD